MLDVALDARVSPETLRKIESGRIATPAFPTIAAIAEVLGLSLDNVWAEISGPDREREREATISLHDAHERVAS
jgi:transcriptional regulator with XRE-family HTH domain